MPFRAPQELHRDIQQFQQRNNQLHMQLSHTTGREQYMKVLTIETARNVLRRLVNMKTPEYVYPHADGGSSCYYVEDGAPSCLIGHLLVELGVPTSEIRPYEGDSAYAVVPQFFELESEWLRRGLSEAQKRQDEGASWGAALEAFEAKVNV